ncbi:MAG: Uma2 family endonuclease [Chloroflexi bacterium]|nr:Uma2 family endonuclease [Chloroflexota bacterium]
MSSQLSRYQLSVSQYDRMVEAGVFPEDARVELIEGELLAMAPIGRRHVAAVNRLTRAFSRAVADGRALLSVQNPIHLDAHNEPQPDVALLRPRPDDYEGSLPTASDVLLLVEVADSSLAYDRDLKTRLYARSGIADYWLVDLQASEVAAWRQPTPHRWVFPPIPPLSPTRGGKGSGYRVARVFHCGETLSPEALPDVAVAVADIVS